MCGICGILDFNRKKVSDETLTRMCRALIHRGPDDEGIFTDLPNSGPAVGLGHRRLKIIDLSVAGHQPMPNEDKTIWIVFNGEIYNYKELRHGLSGKHQFSSDTDTECIIHLYEEYGEDCVKYLRGMFAFAIWDRNKQSLMLARDRVGKKPVLYYHKNNKFVFASEFASLLHSECINREINLEAIDYYLTFGYIPAPFSIYKDVFKLPPAHILVLKDNKVILKKYWDLDYKNKIKITEYDAAQEVLRLLKEAVKIRLYSDVPLGAFLSGGIDSSTIVALMSQLSTDRINTFSIGFEDSDYSELNFAKKIADEFKTDHHVFTVKPEALSILPLLIERYGEPYADSSCIPTYYVSEQTKKFVTVALNGDGGDEVFAGYDRYQAILAADKIPGGVSKAIRLLSSAIPDSINFKSKARRIKRFLSGSALPFDSRYLKWVSIFDNQYKKDMYSESFINSIQSNSQSYLKTFLDKSKELGLIDSLLLTDTMTYLPNDLLVKIDITSMANSLEARSPFLDQKLMEFVASLPAGYKIKNFVKKHILKTAIKGLIPDENINRKKMGFGVPVGRWFRNELKDFLKETLLSHDSLDRGYFRPEAVRKMIKLHIERKADYSFQLWALLMLELWHKRFKD